MFLDPQEILNHVRIPFGSRVADLGTGAGHYALAALNRLEGSGTVYAFDAFTPVLDPLHRRAQKQNARLYTLHADLNSHIPLKNDLIKVAIAANILHQIDDKARFAEEVKRVLEPGGEALVVDWASSFRNMGPPEERVVTPAEAARLFEKTGFEIGSMLPAGTHHFAFIARLPE